MKSGSNLDDTASGRDWIGLSLGLLAVGAFGLGLLLVADTWRVNPDGSAYISLAQALVSGDGYTWPDDSMATFRGPGYSALIAAAFTFLENSARTAIWASRAVLVANAILVAAIVFRLNRRLEAAIGAGLVLAASPLLFEAGAIQFVPDGFVMFWILLAVLVAIPRRDAESPQSRLRAFAAGVLLGFAILTKETSVLALPIVLAAIYVAGERLRDTVAAMALASAACLAVVAAWFVAAKIGSGTLPAPLAGLSGSESVALIALVVIAVVGLLGLAARPALLPDRRLPRPTRSVVLVLAAGFMVFTFLALALSSGDLIAPLSDLPGRFVDDVSWQLYGRRGLDLLLVGVFAGTIVVLATSRGPASELLIGYAFLAYGLGTAFYATQRNFGVRNGVSMAFGVALLAGIALSTLTWQKRSRQTFAVTAVTLVAISGLFLVDARAVIDSSDRRAVTRGQRTWEGPVVTDTASWLASHAADAHVAGSFFYMTGIGSLTRHVLDLHLVPMFGAVPVAADASGLDFDRMNWWAATIPGSPGVADDRPIAVTRSDRLVGLVLEAELIDALERGGASHLVVTGNQSTYPSNTFDAAVLVPYLDASPSFARRFEVGTDGTAQWAIVYEVLSYETAPRAPTAVTPEAASFLGPGTSPLVLSRSDLRQVLNPG